MAGRVTAVLFLFLAHPLFPQCQYQLEYSGQFRSSFLDLSIDGSDLWAATGYGVQRFDRSTDPPRVVGTVALPGLTQRVRARAGVAYVASGTSIHVVRKGERELDRVRSVDVGAPINDLLIDGNQLLAATTAGVVTLDVTQALEPMVMATQLADRPVYSLARSSTMIFAADGDNTIEILTGPTGPVSPSPLPTLVRATSVHVIGSRLYASDGQQTDIFFLGSTPIRLAVIPLGASSIVRIHDDIVFMAGRDRRLRALDLSVVELPVELFVSDVNPTGGSINRVTSLASMDGRLYVGGGDTGLLTFDTSAFSSPFPLRSYASGPKTSVVAAQTAVYVGNAEGGLSQFTRSGSGALTFIRTWAESARHVVHDVANDFLLTSSGANLTYWTIRSTTPAAVSRATFRAEVRSAVLSVNKAYALLADGSLWSADLRQEAPAPALIPTPGGPVSFLARSSSGMAVAELTGDGKTVLSYFAGENFVAPPSRVIVDGATTTLGLDGSTAVVFTYEGITLRPFGSGTAGYVLRDSNREFVTEIDVREGRVIAATESGVRVWALATGQLWSFNLPSPALDVELAPEARFAAVTTSDGLASIAYENAFKQPVLMAVNRPNRYHHKAVAAASRLYLLDGPTIDVYETSADGAPRFVTSLVVPGTIDIAASEAALFTLTSGGTVTAHSPFGVTGHSMTLDEGSDAVPLRIVTVSGVPWVSLSRGCLTTGCEKKTLVLDRHTLAAVSAIEGGITSISTSGNFASALVDLPAQLRLYSMDDPRHPVEIAVRPVEGSSAITAMNGSHTFTLGEKVYVYDVPSLTKVGEQIRAPATQMVIDGGCATIAAGAVAETYAVTGSQLSPIGSLPLPGNVRAIAVESGRLMILTDYSIEIWSREPVQPPARRRTGR